MKIDATLLKKLRTAENLSQEQLSEKCGLSLRTIQRLEGGGNASIESVRALAAAFGLDPSELDAQRSRAAANATGRGVLPDCARLVTSPARRRGMSFGGFWRLWCW